MNNLRRHRRYKVDTKASINAIGRRNDLMDCYITDVSEAGIQVRLPLPVPLGESVQVDVEGLILLGVVRNHELHSGACLVGIELFHEVDKITLEALVRNWYPAYRPDLAIHSTLGLARGSAPHE